MDEGDPARLYGPPQTVEGDPHKVIEGMIVAGVATGSTEGYIYVRAEYPMAVHRLTVAIEQAKELGLLDDNILAAASTSTCTSTAAQARSSAARARP